MRPVTRFFAWLIFVSLIFATSNLLIAERREPSGDVRETSAEPDGLRRSATSPSTTTTLSRAQVLVGSLTVFTLAVIVGFEIIAKVPPTLHTPLMSGSNAISGITIVGALIAAGNQHGGIAAFFGLVAVILANINVVGGFWVTHRMLLMFKKK